MGGDLHQVIADELESIALEGHDLSALDEAKAQGAALGAISSLIRRPFKTEFPPLMAALLLKMPGGKWKFAVTVHHLVCDGWSLEVLARDFLEIYRALSAGELPSLPQLEMDYSDFAMREQSKTIDRADSASRLSFWTKYLDGIASLESYTKPSMITFPRGAIEIRTTVSDIPTKVRLLARQEGVTPFVIYLSAYCALLSRYFDQDDFVVGIPSAGRDDPDYHDVVGLFVDLFPFRCPSITEVTFLSLVQITQNQVLECLEKLVPLESLISHLNPLRQGARHPIFQATFQWGLLNATEPATAAAIHNGTSRFDLSLQVLESSNKTEFVLEYAVELFNQPSARDFLHILESYLSHLLDWPSQPIDSFDLSANGHPPASTFAGKEVALSATGGILDALSRHSVESPNKAAVVDADGTPMTYSGLSDAVTSLASELTTRGLSSGDLIPIVLPRSSEWIVSLLAAWRIGAGFASIEPEQPESRISLLLHRMDSHYVIAKQEYSSQIETIHVRKDLTDYAQFRSHVAEDIPLHNVAYVIFTSGSTGIPKGVVINHLGVSNLVQWHLAEYGVSPEDRAGLTSSIGFDAAIWETLPYLAAGATLYVTPDPVRIDPLALQEWLLENQISIAFVPAPMVEPLLSLPWPENVALRIMLTGGDRLLYRPPPGLPFRLVNHYGPTEATVVATAGFVEPSLDSKPSIGLPIQNTEIHIVDRKGRLVPSGMLGEILIGGVGVGQGYLDDPAATERAFITHGRTGRRLYRSGDLARVTDGQIQFSGRRDHQIKVRGYRVELAEIEWALLAHPVVSASVVLTSERGAAQIHAFATVAGDVTPAELRTFMEGKLPVYMLPTSLTIVDEFPMTINGKIDRNSLLRSVATAKLPMISRALPDLTEERLVVLWQELLEVEAGPDDDFFEIGGNSLLAIALMAKVHRVFGQDIRLGEFLESPTIAHLASQISRGGPKTHSCIVSIASDGAGTPLFFFHPGCGDILHLRYLKAVAADRPILGLLPIGQDGIVNSVASIKDMAAHYLFEITQIQPTGPYLIAGYSVGGLAALEIAHQLMSKGETIAFLGLFEATLPSKGLGAFHLGEVLRYSRLEELRHDLESVKRAKEALKVQFPTIERNEESLGRALEALRQWCDVIWEELRTHNLLAQVTDRDVLYRALEAWAKYLYAARTYLPPSYSGDAFIFKGKETADSPIEAEWQKFIRGTVRVVTVDSEHLDFMKDSTLDGVFAELLNQSDRNSRLRSVTKAHFNK